MSLKFRPTGLGSGIDKDRPDYTVYTGECEVGRIYRTRGGPDSLRWFWSLTVNGPMTRSDRVATLEEARRSFRRAGTPGRRGRSWKRLPERRPGRCADGSGNTPCPTPDRVWPTPPSTSASARARERLGWQVPIGSASLPTARGTKRRATD